MLSNSYDKLIKKFIAGVDATKNIDYLSRQSIRKNNRGVVTYRKTAQMIGKQYPEKIGEFASFLDSDDQKLKVCTAHCLLELMPCTREIEGKALKVLRDYMDNCPQCDTIGYEIWFDMWESGEISEKKRKLLSES